MSRTCPGLTQDPVRICLRLARDSAPNSTRTSLGLDQDPLEWPNLPKTSPRPIRNLTGTPLKLDRDSPRTSSGLDQEPFGIQLNLPWTLLRLTWDLSKTRLGPCQDLIETTPRPNVKKYFRRKTFLGIWNVQKIILNSKLQKCPYRVPTRFRADNSKVLIRSRQG
jgi:hypothetical protein